MIIYGSKEGSGKKTRARNIINEMYDNDDIIFSTIKLHEYKKDKIIFKYFISN